MKKFLLLSFMLVSMMSFIWAQEKSLSGQLVGEDGSGLPGVNVVVKSTTIGTITDFDGNYRLSVPEDASTLVFTYIGFATQEVEIGARSVIDVTMSVDVTELQEVVVTAQGIQRKKEALGFAVSSIGADEVADKTEGDVVRSMRSKASGVQITQQSGLSGSGTNVIIRGYTSITGDNQPLFIVDGVPFNSGTNLSQGNQNPDRAGDEFVDGANNGSSRFLDLDPNNIEDISILKGLAASTLYGQQGRNGVILITTKGGASGNVNKKMDITITQSVFANKIASLGDYQNDFGNGFNAVFGWFFSNWGPGFFKDGLAGWGADAVIDGQGNLEHPYSQWTNPALRAVFPEFQAGQPGNTYPWQSYKPTENFYKTGVVNTTSVNVRGRSDDGKSSFNANAGFLNDEGFLPGNELQRINFGIGGRTKLANNFTINSTLNLSKTDFVAPPMAASTGNGAFFDNIGNAATPISSAVNGHVPFTPRSVDLNGLPFQNPVTGGSVYYRNGNDIQNPNWTVANAFNGQVVNRVYGNTGVTYDINDNLNVAYRVGYDIFTEDNSGGQNVGGLDGFTTGGYRTFANTNTIWDHTFTVNGAYDLSEASRLSFNVGATSRRNELKRQGVTSQNQLVYGIFRHFNFTAQSPIQFSTEQNIVGIFGQAEFDYNGYLFVTLAGRNDAVSNFAKDNRSLFYPSISAAFILSDLVPEITNNGLIDFVKIRTGFGTSAGFRAGFPTASTLDLNPREFTSGGAVISTNTTGTQLGNPALKPERQEEIEIGAELRGWNNRASIDVSWYRRASTDLIVQRPLDPSTGYLNTFTNIGEVINKGFEADLNVEVLSVNDLSWNVRANFTTTTSEVTELGEGVDQINIAGFTNRGNFAIEGEPLGVMYAATSALSDNGALEIDNTGSVEESGENSKIGNPIPDFTLNFSNNVKYKNFNLNFVFNHVQGGDIWSATISALPGRGVSSDTRDRIKTFIIPGERNLGTTEAPQWVKNDVQIVNSTYWFSNILFGPDELQVTDGTALRLQEVSLSYSLPKVLLDNTPFGSVTFTASGFNLWYEAFNAPKGTNFDPNAAGLGVGNGQGFEYLNAPSSRRYGGTLKLTF